MRRNKAIARRLIETNSGAHVLSRYNEDVTDGLTLAPPAPPASNQLNSDAGITETLGNTSWWRQHW